MKLALFFFLAFFLIFNSFSQQYNPVARDSATVISGNARFSILTSGVIRFEWSETGKFNDLATTVVVNRNLSIPKFTVLKNEDWLTIRTEKLVISYKINSGRFTPENLSISSNSATINWHPGMPNKGNLKGTTRTLDGYNADWHPGKKEKLILDNGILSRDGWFLLDDSQSPIFDNSEYPWPISSSNNIQQDFYFFGYGHNYKQALLDFTLISGSIPMPPEYVFGNWWTRWWSYTEKELRELVGEFEQNDIPLDVLVVDMDWHITSTPEFTKDNAKQNNQAGEIFGWTGYTWNKNYFPYPQDFLKWCDLHGIKNCLNLHPSSGIQPHEEKYSEMASSIGFDTKSKKYIPLDLTNKNQINNFYKVIIEPLEQQGVDFWWLDWQQSNNTSIQNLNPTFMLNYIFFTKMQQQHKSRPLIFHRYGGLGNQRYQIGFSGDTETSWESLDYQLYFTPTASNVCYGYWSHDIGGHADGWDYEKNAMKHKPKNPELYTRWIQFGAFSPILRTHSTKDPLLDRRIWSYPSEYFKAMRDVILLRYSLVPYIYNASYIAHKTGVSICRPLYYEYPYKEEAYTFSKQYFFGDNILVAPIAHPIDSGNIYTMQKVWLPKGKWYELNSQTILEGDRTIERPFTIENIPVYIKAGSIIPLQQKVNNLKKNKQEKLIYTIIPGGNNDSARVYDDEKDNENYLSGNFSFNRISYIYKDSILEITILPVEGNYPGIASDKSYEIRLPLSMPAYSIFLNETIIEYSNLAKTNTWNYNGENLTLTINTQKLAVNKSHKLIINLPPQNIALLSGKIDKINRLYKFSKELAGTFEFHTPTHTFDPVFNAVETGYRVSVNPVTIKKELMYFDLKWPDIISITQKASLDKKQLKPYFDYLNKF